MCLFRQRPQSLTIKLLVESTSLGLAQTLKPRASMASRQPRRELEHHRVIHGSWSRRRDSEVQRTITTETVQESTVFSQ